MRVRVLYHDHCFDGAASAAVFTRFLEDRFHPGAEFLFTGMAHKASQLFEDELFDGDVNAIVDFKYSANPKLDWWFDHHQSAFLTPADAEHFRREKHPTKFLDVSYKSCTQFIADVAADDAEARVRCQAVAVEEQVVDGDAVAGVEQLRHEHGADVAGAAGDHDVAVARGARG